MASRRYRRRIGVLALLLALMSPWSASALSLYDVVELSRAGYSDRKILHLIADTGSRFVVDAKILVALKAAGVSEAVIRAIVAAKETEPTVPRNEPEARSERPVAPAQAQPDPGRAQEEPDQPRSEVPTAGGPERLEDETSAVGVFSSYTFAEAANAHGGHEHLALAIRGVPVLILRSEGGYGTVAARAEAVTRRLNALALSPGGHFVAAPGSPTGVSYHRDDAGPAVEVLPVQAGDVVAYQRQSLGVVSAQRLASYWAASLSDYTQLFVFRRPPTELVRLHLGETLINIYQGLAADDPRLQGGSKRDAALLGLLDHLTAEDKEHLIELTTRVPAEFAPR